MQLRIGSAIFELKKGKTKKSEKKQENLGISLDTINRRLVKFIKYGLRTGYVRE